MSACPACGHENPEGGKFCSECGSVLFAGPAREERKVVTVLFADLVGFTSRAERLDPEDVRALLGPYYARVRAELERHGGTVEKFIGDAVMALFGAPVAHEDDPERAVRAALAIREAVAEMNAADPALELQLRIGVNTGEALVALDARPREGEGMAAGDVVNTAARLQTAAPTNGILVADKTYQATKQAIEYREADPIQAKGKAERVPAWEAVAARSRFGIDLPQRTGAPLMGRGDELDTLRDALARARREQSAQLVTLAGVPGIGKSRLVAELFAEVDAEEDLIWWRQGRSLPYGEGVSFWALGEMVKAHAGILETDEPEAAAEKLRTAVAGLPEPEWLERHLRPLAGLTGDEAEGDRRGEAFAAWRRFFEALAEQRPLVLVFEDLHWADDGLLDFVDHLADWASGVPILVVGTARPELLERRPGWGGGKRNAATLSLSPLSDDDTARLVAALLDRSVIDAGVQAELLRRAEGNPLYAEEFVRLLAEGRPPDTLPETVQGIIAARLDALAAGEKTLVQDASVFGKVFWAGALAALEGGERWEVEERLHTLERKEFVRRDRRSSVEGDAEYAFLHALVREVAYGQIPRAVRAEKHRRAAAWIESLGRPEDTAEMLAHHYLAALEYARAAGQDTASFADRARLALRDAGDRAWSLSAYATSARFHAAALELWPEEDPDRAEVEFSCGRAQFHDDATGIELMERSAGALESLGRHEGAADAAVVLGRAHWVQGDRASSSVWYERALSLTEGTSSAMRAGVLAAWAGSLNVRGRRAEAVTIGREALALAEQFELPAVAARALNAMGSARVALGDVGGTEDLERSVEIARAAQAYDQLSVGLNNLMNSYAMTGRLSDAVATYDILARHAESYSAANRRWVAGQEVMLSVFTGAWERAAAAADAFLAEVEGGQPHYLEGTCRYGRAIIRLGRGDIAGADADSARGLEFGRKVEDPQVLANMLVVRASVLAATGREVGGAEALDELLAGGQLFAAAVGDYPGAVDAAFAAADLGRADELRAALEALPYRHPWAEAALHVVRGELPEAVEVVAATGNRTLEALLRLRLAGELVAEGRRAEADEQLGPALAFYRSVGATRYVREGEALLAESA